MALMFVVNDGLLFRQRYVRKFAGRELPLGAVVAVMDFEWTVRRAIIALGYRPNAVIRSTVLKNCSSPKGYKNAWKEEVYPVHAMKLPQIVPEWSVLVNDAFILRHRIVHGSNSLPSNKLALECRECALAATESVVQFARDCDVDLYSRLPIRRRTREITR